MRTTTTMKTTATTRRLLTGLAAGLALTAFAETSQAQEILLTGPLAGAPAVRKLRLYRQGRFEVAPMATFTLLDEYRRTIFLGGRISYNFTDWLAVGAWGGYGGLIRFNTGLTEKIQRVNETRREDPGWNTSVDRRLTEVNMGDNFEDQLGGIDWIVVPQITGVPFRGKLALFRSIYVDTELFFFLGPAIVGVTEREHCSDDTGSDLPACPNAFDTESRTAFTASGGMGFSFFANEWNALTAEARITPFGWNIAGFDTTGGGPDKEFPDRDVDEADRQFRFNMMLAVGWSFYLPTAFRISE